MEKQPWGIKIDPVILKSHYIHEHHAQELYTWIFHFNEGEYPEIGRNNVENLQQPGKPHPFMHSHSN